MNLSHALDFMNGNAVYAAQGNEHLLYVHAHHVIIYFILN